MARVGIVGSGNLGANTAFFMAEKSVADCLLYDTKEGLAKGKTLDLMEASPLRRYHTWIHDTDNFDDVTDCDMLVLAAGTPRSQGQSRDDLFSVNAPLVADYARKLAAGADGCAALPVILVVTEPVDALTTLFHRILEDSVCTSTLGPPVMGLGTVLDSYRLQYLLAETLGIVSDDIQVTVLGRHADDVLVDFDHCSVAGIGIRHLLGPKDLEHVRGRLVEAGDAIIRLAGRNSSYYAPSVAVADIAEAILKNTGGVFSVSHQAPELWEAYPELEGAALSIPSVLGREGVRRTMMPPLGDTARRILGESARKVRELVDAWMAGQATGQGGRTV